jgi:diguanylate cyclase (GGDEF)-like protein
MRILNEEPPPDPDDEIAELPYMNEIRDNILTMRDIIFNMWTEENTILEQKTHLQYLADHDPLTGALNRRAFVRQAIVGIEKHRRHLTHCGIIMMDIDFFKRFNDTYGHAAGDKALRHLVNVISAFMRKDDFLGRYGGEEFVFFFDNADAESGAAIAERFRKELETTPVPLPPSAAAITASFGVASMSNLDGQGEIDDQFVEKLINLADQALYQAKNSGRNKVVLFKSTP